MYKIVVEIPEGWGGYFSGPKMEIPGRTGVYIKFPPWWGYGYFLELHNVHLVLIEILFNIGVVPTLTNSKNWPRQQIF